MQALGAFTVTSLPNAEKPYRLVLREIASHTAITFLSTLAIQATTFAILALAAVILPVGEFARLSLIVAAVMLASALFELGLNITSTKMYGDTRDEGYLHFAFLIRLGLVPLGAVIGAAVAFAGLSDIGLGIALGAILNIWNGMRATDQARQDYGSFARSSAVFAVLRATAGLFALFVFHDAPLVAIAVYAVPVVACLTSASARLFREALSAPRPEIAGVLRYGTYVYINAVTFIAIPYVPQFFVASRLDAVHVGTYGLILTFLGPISLVVNSLYNVLLPKMLGTNSSVEGMLWSRRGAIAIVMLWLVMLAGSGVLAAGLNAVYQARFPGIVPMFLLYFAGFSASTLLGIYTLSVHTQGVPQINMVVNAVRLVALLAALYGFGRSLSSIILIVVCMMVIGQIAVVAWLSRRRFLSSRVQSCAE